MPSRIENIFNSILDNIETALPDYHRLPNAYEITENGFITLDKGYACAIGPGVDTQRYIGCLMTWERAFTITLVRKVMVTRNDTEARLAIEKGLLDDFDDLSKRFYQESVLDGYAIKATITDDSGLAFIDGDRNKFLAIELTLLVEYQDDPTQ